MAKKSPSKDDHVDYVVQSPTVLQFESHVLKWAVDLSWDLGVHDFHSYTSAAGPECFLIGVLDGVPIANISIIPQGPDYGHISLYVVAPRYRERGLGYGRRLFDAAVARMPATMCLGLDAVQDNVPMYMSGGFKVADGVTVMRYTITVADSDECKLMQTWKLDNEAVSWSVCKVNTPNLLEKVVEYDRKVMSLDRGALFRAWLGANDGTMGSGSAHTDRYAVCVLQGSTVIGYGMSPTNASPDKSGPFVVGPVCCDSADIATRVLGHLQGRLQAGVSCSLFSPSRHGHDVLTKCGWSADGVVYHRMHLCRPSSREPRYELSKIFAGYTPDIA